MTMNMTKTIYAAALTALTALVACKSSEAVPEDTISTSAGSEDGATTANPTSGTPTTSADGSDTVGPADGTASSSGGPIDTSGGPECLGPDDCWQCAPVNNEQVINGCTDATCQAFDNSPERLPLLEDDGTLPPLP